MPPLPSSRTSTYPATSCRHAWACSRHAAQSRANANGLATLLGSAVPHARHVAAVGFADARPRAGPTRGVAAAGTARTLVGGAATGVLCFGFGPPGGAGVGPSDASNETRRIVRPAWI